MMLAIAKPSPADPSQRKTVNRKNYSSGAIRLNGLVTADVSPAGLDSASQQCIAGDYHFVDNAHALHGNSDQCHVAKAHSLLNQVPQHWTSLETKLAGHAIPQNCLHQTWAAAHLAIHRLELPIGSIELCVLHFFFTQFRLLV